MAKSDGVLKKLREICLSLPDTKETLTWGKPHFRVGDKIFAGYGEEKGRPSIGFKLTMPHAASIVRDERFSPAPYVGHKGWVSMAADGVRDLEELRSLIFESYQLIAPKKSLAKLTGEPASPSRASKSAREAPRKKASPKKRAAKKKTGKRA